MGRCQNKCMAHDSHDEKNNYKTWQLCSGFYSMMPYCMLKHETGSFCAQFYEQWLQHYTLYNAVICYISQPFDLFNTLLKMSSIKNRSTKFAKSLIFQRPRSILPRQTTAYCLPRPARFIIFNLSEILWNNTEQYDLLLASNQIYCHS